MEFYDELLARARNEIRNRNDYHELAERLKEGGYPDEALSADSIARGADEHADSLMTMATSIESKKEPKEIRRRAEEVLDGISQPLTLELRPFPQTYGDWVNLAEDIKGESPDDPVMIPIINDKLSQISNETEGAAAAKRWLIERAGDLGIK